MQQQQQQQQLLLLLLVLAIGWGQLDGDSGCSNCGRPGTSTRQQQQGRPAAAAQQQQQQQQQQQHEKADAFSSVCFVCADPCISTTNGTPTLALPLAVVVVVNACKDAYEDIQRHRSDRLENLQPTHSLPRSAGEAAAYAQREKKQRQKEAAAAAAGDTAFREALIALEEEDDEDGVGSEGHTPETLMQQEAQRRQEQQQQQQQETDRSLMRQLGLLERRWRDVQLGDIIVCFKNEAFAADMILLGSSDPKGLAFIETSSLDGETNLKLKQTAKGQLVSLPPSSLSKALAVAKDLEGRLVTKQPNRDLGSFEGLLYMRTHATAMAPVRSPTRLARDSFPGGGGGGGGGGRHHAENPKPLAIASSQILLRGCRLRNTDWVIGLVVYTGKQTKIQMVIYYCPSHRTKED
ncbi:hypothetical protein ACSSS7_001160 [Eimeria intestinalis]